MAEVEGKRVLTEWRKHGEAEAGKPGLIDGGRRRATAADCDVVPDQESIQVAVLIVCTSSQSPHHRSLLADAHTQSRQDLRDIGLFCHDIAPYC